MALTVGDRCRGFHTVFLLCFWLTLGDILIEDLVLDKGATCQERADLLEDLKVWTQSCSFTLTTDFGF